MRNIYTGPGQDHLQRQVSEGYVWGTMEISDFEIKTHFTNEGTLVALMTARFRAVLDDMVESLCMSTLPVHDEPGEPCDSSWHYTS